MLDRNAFMETLHAVQEVAKTSDQPMSREAALSYFKDMDLSPEQEEMIYQFLMLPPEEETEEEEEGTKDSREADGADWEDNGSNAADGVKAESAAEDEQPEASAHFNLYLDEVNEISELELDVEAKLYQSLLAGDTSVITAISTQWLKRVIAIAEKYKGKGYLLDDLVQEGNMGLLMELHALASGEELESGENINVHLTEAVQEAIELYIGEESGEEQENETILGKVSLVHAAQKFLTEEKGAVPSMQELAEYTKIPMDEIEDILSLIKEK